MKHSDLRARPRVVIGGLHHETHTFLNALTTEDDFVWARGEGVLDCGTSSPLAGALCVARECDWELLPLLDVRGLAGPTVADTVVEKWWREWEIGLQNLQRQGGFEAIFLTLHGAMVSQSLRDVEGEILRRLRELVGPQVLIVGATDLHGNFSPAMAQNADALCTYRQNPHTDCFETGARAARLLDEMLRTGRRTRQFFARAPLLWAPPGTGTAASPMRELEALARSLEAKNPSFGSVDVYAGFAFADTPDAGVSFSIATWGDENQARTALDALVETSWRARDLGQARETGAVPALELAAQWLESRPLPHRPVVFAEPSDNIGGGAPGDGTHLLRAALEHDFGVGETIHIATTLNDPQNVSLLQGLKNGESALLWLGGHSSPLSGEPLPLRVEKLRESNGQFALDDPHSHLAAQGTALVDMGPSVLVRARLECPQTASTNVAFVLLTSIPTPPFDLGQWRCLGANPREFDLIICKAAVGHRQAYDPIAFANLTVATPGVCASDLKALPFRLVPRPIFPLDPITRFARSARELATV